MTDTVQLDQLADRIRVLYREHGERSAAHVEELLDQAFTEFPVDQRQNLLAELSSKFAALQPTHVAAPELTTHSLNNLLTMLLGKEILKKELSSEEMIEQLAAALNTVFDSVNKLINGINITLMGSAEGEETIRVVISSSIDQEQGLASIEKYLDQIGEFFAIALQAFKDAAQIKIGEILQEFNPQRIEEAANPSMKFGPLRKAHLYDCFQDKFTTMQNWQRSGLLLEAFVKEFEKNCQNLYMKRE